MQIVEETDKPGISYCYQVVPWRCNEWIRSSTWKSDQFNFCILRICV